MKNLYYYLFYKINLVLNKKGNNEWGVIYAISLFVALYLGIFYVKVLLPLLQVSYEGAHKYISGSIAILVFIGNAKLFLDKKRVNKIMGQYQNESGIRRKIGSFLVVIFIIFCFALVLFL